MDFLYCLIASREVSKRKKRRKRARQSQRFAEQIAIMQASIERQKLLKAEQKAKRAENHGHQESI